MIILKINRVKTANGDYNYYLAKSVRKNNKVSTVNLKPLGKHSELLKIYDDPFLELKKYAKEKTLEERIEQGDLNYQLIQRPLNSNEAISNTKLKNIGHFYLSDIIDGLDLKGLFKDIKENLKIKYDPYQITKHLIIDRVIYPRSKFGTYKHLHQYYSAPQIKNQDIFKTLDLISNNLLTYQEHLYKNSRKIVKRNTKVLYYDCTNFYFETNKTGGLIQHVFGKDKNGKPLVGLGLFMDGDGIPLAFDVHSGNTNEQTTVLPLERKIVKDFGLSDFIYISDGGINSNEIRFFNTLNNRDFILAEPLKKLSKEDLEIVFSNDNWYELGDKRNKRYLMEDILKFEKEKPNEAINRVFYKDFILNKPIDIGLKEKTENNRITNKTAFKQRLIVTYKPKYKLYKEALRLGQIERAYKIINNKTYNNKKANNPNRYIDLGINHENVDIDLKTLEKDIKFDGYYGLVTSLFEDSVEDILKVNSFKWKIEDNIKVFKFHLKTRPVFHRMDERIIAHLTICFTALLVIRLLENLIDDPTFTTTQILNQLKTMQVNPTNLSIYEATYTGSNLLDKLDEIFNKNLRMDKYTNIQLNKNKRNSLIK